MISTYPLLDDLRTSFREAFRGVHFREPVERGNALTSAGKGKYREPRVYIGRIPPKEYKGGPSVPPPADQGEDVPYIIVKIPGAGVTGEQPREFRVDVAIVFEAFVPESDPDAGTEDVMNIADRIIGVLCGRRYWCGGKFVQSLPVDFIFGTGRAETPYLSGLQAQGPYYGGAITTQFTAAAPPQIPPPGIVDAAEPGH